MKARLVIFLIALTAAFSLASRVHAQNASPLQLLENAHATLASADHDYDGHRVKAMHEIQEAVHELGGGGTSTVHTRGHQSIHVRHTAHGSGREPEPQNVSDAKLRSAEGLLQEALSNLAGRTSRHLNAALGQLHTALNIR